MKFSNILLILDSGRPYQAQALRRAVALARTTGAKLAVCEVLDWVLPHAPRYMTDGTVGILTREIQYGRIERLRRLIANCDVEDLSISVDVLLGEPENEVARVVRANRHDLVIKSCSGHRHLRFFSSAQENRALIRSCPCPVWLLNVAAHDNDKGILAALDMPGDNSPEAMLNRLIVEVSNSIAVADSRPLHFVHAWQSRGEWHMRGQRNPAAELEIDRMRAREAARRRTWLQNTIATLQTGAGHSMMEDVSPEFHVIYGQAKKVIPDLAEKLGVGLIVMGSADRTGLPGLVHRNTAEMVLPRLDCSVLVVKQSRSSQVGATEAIRADRYG